MQVQQYSCKYDGIRQIANLVADAVSGVQESHGKKAMLGLGHGYKRNARALTPQKFLEIPSLQL